MEYKITWGERCRDCQRADDPGDWPEPSAIVFDCRGKQNGCSQMRTLYLVEHRGDDPLDVNDMLRSLDETRG